MIWQHPDTLKYHISLKDDVKTLCGKRTPLMKIKDALPVDADRYPDDICKSCHARAEAKLNPPRCSKDSNKMLSPLFKGFK